MKIKILIIFIVFSFLPILFFGCSGSDESSENINESTEKKEANIYKGFVTGIIRLVGNEPHTQLVITGVSDLEEETRVDYLIKGDKISELREYMYKQIKAYGGIEKHFIRFANSEDGVNKYSITVESYEILD